MLDFCPLTLCAFSVNEYLFNGKGAWVPIPQMPHFRKQRCQSLIKTYWCHNLVFCIILSVSPHRECLHVCTMISVLVLTYLFPKMWHLRDSNNYTTAVEQAFYNTERLDPRSKLRTDTFPYRVQCHVGQVRHMPNSQLRRLTIMLYYVVFVPSLLCKFPILSPHVTYVSLIWYSYYCS